MTTAFATCDFLERLQKMRCSIARESWDKFLGDKQRIAELATMFDGLGNAGDDLYDNAVCLTIKQRKGSVSMLQPELGLGYGRVSRLIDVMAQDGIVGPYSGAIFSSQVSNGYG